MRSRPRRLLLLGHPVTHSLSPQFQNAALRAAGIPLVYEALDTPSARLRTTVATLREDDAAGNVTIPHKEAMVAQCDDLTAVARRVGAVNTFWSDEGRLIGDNTDVGGFHAAVRALRGDAVPPRVVAILGAGGAAAAALAAVEQWPGARARVLGRTPARARALCDRFPGMAEVAADVEALLNDADLIVNATPIGLTNDAIPVDPALVDRRAAVLDLVYRPDETAWVRAARARGLGAADGTTMLLEQGALAFERWFGIAPDRRVMRTALAR